MRLELIVHDENQTDDYGNPCTSHTSWEIPTPSDCDDLSSTEQHHLVESARRTMQASVNMGVYDSVIVVGEAEKDRPAKRIVVGAQGWIDAMRAAYTDIASDSFQSETVARCKGRTRNMLKQLEAAFPNL